MNKDSGSGFFMGLVVGALAGLVVGFMYAPRSGTETRRVAKEKIANLKEGASTAAGTVRDRASTAAGTVRDSVQSRIARTEE